MARTPLRNRAEVARLDPTKYLLLESEASHPGPEVRSPRCDKREANWRASRCTPWRGRISWRSTEGEAFAQLAPFAVSDWFGCRGPGWPGVCCWWRPATRSPRERLSAAAPASATPSWDPDLGAESPLALESAGH